MIDKKLMVVSYPCLS